MITACGWRELRCLSSDQDIHDVRTNKQNSQDGLYNYFISSKT
jgi:hypothetical protein